MSPEQPRETPGNLPESLQTEQLKPVEISDYPGLFDLSRKKARFQEVDWNSVQESVKNEYYQMLQTVEQKVQHIVGVAKADTQSADPEMIVPGSLASDIASVFIAAAQYNLNDMSQAMNNMLQRLGPEDIAAYNQLAPLHKALGLIDQARSSSER